MRLFSFGGYGFALAALALVVFGAYDSYPDEFGSVWLEGIWLGSWVGWTTYKVTRNSRLSHGESLL